MKMARLITLLATTGTVLFNMGYGLDHWESWVILSCYVMGTSWEGFWG